MIACTSDLAGEKRRDLANDPRFLRRVIHDVLLSPILTLSLHRDYIAVIA